MIDAHRSVLLAVAAERKRMHAEIEALRAELNAEIAALYDALDAAKLEHLNFKAAVTKDKVKLALINRERMLINAQLAQHADGWLQ